MEKKKFSKTKSGKRVIELKTLIYANRKLHGEKKMSCKGKHDKSIKILRLRYHIKRKKI